MRPVRRRFGPRSHWLMPVLAGFIALALVLAPAWKAAQAQNLPPGLPGSELSRTAAPIMLDGRTLFRIWPSSTLSAEQRSDTINQQLAETAAGEGAVALELQMSNNLPVLLLNGRTLLTVTERDVAEGMEAMEQAEAWRQQLEQALKRARAERRPEHLRRQLPRGLAVLALAAGLHRGLQALWRRRFPQAWVIQPAETSDPQTSAGRLLQRVTLGLLQAGVWIAALAWISDQFPSTRSARAAVLQATGRWLVVPFLPLGARSYSLLDAVILLTLLLLLVRAVGLVLRLLRTRVLRYTGMSLGGQEAVAFLTRYGLLFLGALVLLQLWGLDLSSLTLFASVLGVGVGLGFQMISKNLLSGMVIIFERPIQVGDFVEIGDLQGTVQKLGLRSTVVETLDRIAIIVPNSEFLDSRVVNWSHGSPVSRLRLPVGVAYGSDTTTVREVLIQACEGQPLVLREPPPRVLFSSFGDSALNFTLLVWIREPMRQYQIKSDLNFRIEALLRERGISVPFPQRDLHLSGEGLELRLSPELERRLIDHQQQRGGGTPP